MTEQQRQQPATEKQYSFLGRLRNERQMPADASLRLRQRCAEQNMTKGEASDAIAWCLDQPKVQYVQSTGQPDLDAELEQQTEGTVRVKDERVPVDGPGVFEQADGTVYVVKRSKADRLYAKRLVELRDTQGDRVTDEGGHVRFDFEYARGAVYGLSEADRMTTDRAKELMVRYGRCVNCGRGLKVAESVERGYGPVCAKLFREVA
jgi:Family of unknown function (DUF6011)